jgi:abortive infection bacteriophage resistance protein
MRYEKPPKTFDEQIDLLLSRGMVIEDRQAAHHYLSHLNYYRLTAYWLPFEADHASHTFHPDTNFNAVLNLYVFDRELRLLLLDAIERVEVSLRTQWAYHLAHDYGAHAYLHSAIARKPDWWQSNLDSLHGEIERADEEFIKHYKRTYTDPPTPPIWGSLRSHVIGSPFKVVYQSQTHAYPHGHCCRLPTGPNGVTGLHPPPNLYPQFMRTP